MAKYHITAQKLKPFVEKANFTKDQLNIMLNLMRSCSQLRQRKVIESFFIEVLPDSFMTETEIKEGIYGKYTELKVI